MVLHELAYVKEWQYHHVMQDDPLEGVPTVGKVFEIFEKKRDAIEAVEYDAVRKEYIIKMIGGAWYSTPEEKLLELRRALRSAGRGRRDASAKD